MGQMAGSSHETMDNMMIQMMGEEGEQLMHIAMGKRISSCDPYAPLPQNLIDSGMMPMIMSSAMMEGGSNSLTGMFGFGWIFMILFSVLVILSIVA